MSLDNNIQEYICGVDIFRGYKDYKERLGSSFHNTSLAATRYFGRFVFDAALIKGITCLAEGNNEGVVVSAGVAAGSAAMDYILNKSREWVIRYRETLRDNDKSNF